MAPCGPLERQTTLSHRQQIPDYCANAANSWIPASGRSRTRTWDLSLIRKTFCPSSPPNSHLIPANGRDGRRRNGTGGTGGYNLVAPSWPHGRNSRAARRKARKRTSRRRHGQARTLRRRAAARLHDRVDRREPRCVIKLVHHAPVGVQSKVGSVIELPGTFSPALAMPPRRHRLPSARGLGGAAEEAVPPRLIS